MSTTTDTTTLIDYRELLDFTTGVFSRAGLSPPRAALAAEALVYGDLTGLASHGLWNLRGLYLPLLSEGRADPAAEPELLSDLGPCALVDTHRALGLWAAAEGMDLAIGRARQYGVGVVSVRGGTHFGCAGYHAARAAEAGMIGVVASNCGMQRIARPPGGSVAMLGTNPLSVAAPALPEHPFVLDMSTTVVPTGKVRAAARLGERVPEGWLTDDAGWPVTDPAAFDDGGAHLRWLGGRQETGAYKGFGLALAVELLAGLVPAAGSGPDPAAYSGDGGPHGRDDDIGFMLLAIDPQTLRAGEDFRGAAESLFRALTGCPAVDSAEPVRYPGWLEAERAARRRVSGVPLPTVLYSELGCLGLDADATSGEI